MIITLHTQQPLQQNSRVFRISSTYKLKCPHKLSTQYNYTVARRTQYDSVHHMHNIHVDHNTFIITIFWKCLLRANIEVIFSNWYLYEDLSCLEWGTEWWSRLLCQNTGVDIHSIQGTSHLWGQITMITRLLCYLILEGMKLSRKFCVLIFGSRYCVFEQV